MPQFDGYLLGWGILRRPLVYFNWYKTHKHRPPNYGSTVYCTKFNQKFYLFGNLRFCKVLYEWKFHINLFKLLNCYLGLSTPFLAQTETKWNRDDLMGWDKIIALTNFILLEKAKY